MTALDEGRYRDAVESLEHSRQIRDIPIVNYNLGLAYRGLGRNLDAIPTFERYLARPDPHGSPEEIQSVRAVVAELHASRGRKSLSRSDTAVWVRGVRLLRHQARGRWFLLPERIRPESLTP